ncbi:MAG: hypothetical protein H7Y36_00445 [Armatimonadetes bacterium]|nr:hypothetical protein [Akkermansiaceae bacterium]
MNYIAKYFSIAAFLTAAASAQVNDTSKPTPSPSTKSVLHENPFDDTYQFIFFATLEGLYRDGVTDADVKAMLATKGKEGGYLNFIYTCPICMPVEGAIETYKGRPAIHHLKTLNHQTSERTFGEQGLSKEVSDALRSEKASIRLNAVNELVGRWMAYRMDHSAMTDEQKKNLVEELKKRRKQGMEALRRFSMNSNGPDSMKAFAAGYEDGDECALCNAALQMPIKLKAP